MCPFGGPIAATTDCLNWPTRTRQNAPSSERSSGERVVTVDESVADDLAVDEGFPAFDDPLPLQPLTSAAHIKKNTSERFTTRSYCPR
jgi:hypothetical protein